MATYARGVSSTGVPNYGLIQSLKLTNDAESAVAEDETGAVAAEDFYNEKKTYVLEVVYDTEQSLPAPGNTIAYNSVNYVVESIEDVQENKGYRRVTLTAHKWIDNTVPADV